MGRDAIRLKDAASCSFDCFNNYLKERPDDTVSSIDLQRTVHLCGFFAMKQATTVFGWRGSSSNAASSVWSWSRPACVIGDIPRAPIADPGQILHLLGVGLGDVRDVSGGDKLCH